jgi:hypothetical protein
MQSPKFLVFDTNAGLKGKDGGVIYCLSTKDAGVQWPKLVRRGRPRKGILCSSCHFHLLAVICRLKLLNRIDLAITGNQQLPAVFLHSLDSTCSYS